MNCEEIVLPPVEVKRFQTEPALQCLLHTIIFNRSLHSKNLRPRDADCDIFDISYAQSDNKEVARKVTEGIRNFLKKMDETKIDKGVASIAFYTTKESQNFLMNIFGAREEKFYWEKW
eukprot:CAMPEP_0197539514 /NCGR_PEP_ID=MMETSP1318-20131121/63002_1 /TAXON_ID=552666 /ORGANISM="Partenskyella glossopodia, Strain RCC365" /LENGTH=117 /DNA_ID=CAMNT_0043098257 /DNA_START=83 /DNA_END=433 /DNA_ORIENTATION=+